jgi:serine/threonine-protein kinase
MSPEQARGKPVDKRTDIWSFGVVLFEMLTGARLFVADEVSDTMAFVLTREPDWSTIPVDTPAQIRTLLRRCLQKDRTKRLADIADARLEIDDALSAPPPPAANVVVVAPSGPWRRAVPWAVAGAAVVALLATLALWSPWRSASGATYARVTADLGAQVVVNVGIGGSLALSPDGSTMAFAARLPTDPLLARGQLYVRRLADLHATPVAGTAGAAAPFFSPDGQWIGFFAGGSLKKVNVGGGAVVTLCEAPTPRGGSWIDGDEIVFASLAAGGVGGGVLMRVAATGGHPTPITTAAPEDYGHIWPQALPGDAGILYTAPTSFADYNQARIVVQRDSGDPIVIHTGGYFARYLPSGHLTFVRDGTLFVAPFSLQSAALTGQPVPIIDNLGIAPLGGGALFTASGTGTIAYMSNAAANLISRAPVMWLDRAGGLQSLREDPSGWGTPRLSPDGRRLAFTMSDGGQQDIWIYDWERGTLTRLTSDPANDMVPVWTPDGTRIAFASQRGRAAAQGANLYWQRADGTGEAERLTDSPISQLPDGWHPNGRVLVFHEGDPRTGRQRLMMLPMNGDATSGLKPGAPTELLGGPYLKAFARFSPDGRWLAYVTIEAKVPQVYVQPFPGPGSRLLISSDGGSVPMWSRTRPELYYSTSGGQDQQMMVVRYTVDAGVFTAERPQPLGKARFSANTPLIAYGPGIDLHPDGERFVVAPANPAVDNAESRVVFIFNAFEEVRRLTRATSAQR